MAINPAASAYLADLLTGIGQGFLTAPRGGPPLAGLGLGINNASNLMAMRRQQADQEQERAFRAAQMKRQEQADADAVAAKSAQKAALSQLLPTGANPAGFRPTGAGPAASASVSQSPANPLLAGMSPEQIAFLRSYGGADPGGALSMIGEQAFKAPNLDAPTTKDFNEGGNVVTKQWNPQTKTWDALSTAPRWQPVQAPPLPADVQEYLFAKKQDPSIGTYGSWKKSQSGGDLKYSLNPVYIVNKTTGETSMLLPNTQGGTQQVNPPEGWEIAPQTQFLDTGTGFVPGNKRTGQPIPGAEPIVKNVAQEESLQTQGEGQGKVAAALPDTIAGADLALKTIEDLKSDPAREAATGMSSLLTTKIPGTPAYDYMQKVNQAKGQVFRQVYESLRGGGAITEIEGNKAEQALARLDTAQTEDGFLQALNEIEGIIKSGAERAKQKAAAGPQISAPQGVAPAAPAAPGLPPPPPPGFEVVQ
jgi:hypothetical protein